MPENTFASMGVDARICRNLAANGITAPTPIQALTLADALAGRDICGKAGTGSGKTLAFGVPMVQNVRQAKPSRPTALVLVPTRELASQVAEVLGQVAAKLARVDVFYGGSSMDRQAKSLKRGVDIAVATPGRMIDLMERRLINLSDVEMVVVDEADRMADMGFVPQVNKILAGTGEERHTMLFSATLDADVTVLVRRHMVDPVTHAVPEDQPTVATMTHHFLLVDPAERLEYVERMSSGAERTLVFVRTRDSAERVAERLRDLGVEAEAFYGGLRQSARERALRRFSTGRTAVLVATDVAARGLDVTGLDLVVHYDIPEDHKAYLHRSGRTARGGAQGVVATLVPRHQAREVVRMQKVVGLDTGIVQAALGAPALAGISRGEEFSAQPYEVPERRSESSYAPRRGGSSQWGQRGRRQGSGARYKVR